MVRNRKFPEISGKQRQTYYCWHNYACFTNEETKGRITCPRWYSLYTWSQNSMQSLTSRAHPLHHTGLSSVQFSSVIQSCLTLQCHGLQHGSLPCPPQLPNLAHTHVHQVSDAIQLSHPPAFSCLQSFPASGSFPMSQFFVSGSQNIGASASASAEYADLLPDKTSELGLP